MSSDATSAQRRSASPGVVAFVLAIFLSAFLIFLVQPMVGKRVLPWFGGAPGVWTVCLAFYQTALFAGYAYAHLLIRFAPPRVQLLVHALLVASALAAPSVLPQREAMPGTEWSPEARILVLLLGHVLLPFMVLASTGPLVQSWFARCHPDRSPYPLYAVSNLGSLLALFAYPFLLEPRLGLAETGEYWAVGFAAVGALVLGTAALALRPAPEGASARDIEEEAGRPAVTPGVIALWLALSAAAVVMLNGLTNRLCLDIASVPFLWVLPLATYLATFVIAFSSDRAYRRAPLFALVIGLLALSAFQLAWTDRTNTDAHSGLAMIFTSLSAVILYYTALLFGACFILHGELHRLRPAARSLTLFYLCVSAGGAMGGLFVGLAAPRLFDGYAEFGFGLALVLLLGGYAAARERGGVRAAWSGAGWPVRVAASFALLLAASEAYLAVRTHPAQVHQERNFFGVLRVLEAGEGDSAMRAMMHGTTLHGTQYLEGAWRRSPTSYYGQASSLATAMQARPPGRGARVAVIGLGAGTIAAYARPGDLFRFYEIDPAVIRLARDTGDFTYLSEARGRVEVRQGDGRLSLETEQAAGEAQNYDLLVIDAFSGDAVPVHLLTREAFETYRRSLAPGGVIALHFSNRHFDLMPVLARISVSLGMAHLQVVTRPVPTWRTNPSAWVFVAEQPARLDAFPRVSRSQLQRLRVPSEAHTFSRTTGEGLASVRLWTDDFTDLFGALKTAAPESPQSAP